MTNINVGNPFSLTVVFKPIPFWFKKHKGHNLDYDVKM